LLAALDVPAQRIKGARPELKRGWAKELSLPFKVRAEVCEWLYTLLAPPRRPKRPAGTEISEVGVKRHKEEKKTLEVADSPWSSGSKPPLKDEYQDQKAAKHDDAAVPVHLWNERVRRGSRVTLSDEELEGLRFVLLKYWKRLVGKGFAMWCQCQR
jgi:hypothetical protein